MMLRAIKNSVFLRETSVPLRVIHCFTEGHRGFTEKKKSLFQHRKPVFGRLIVLLTGSQNRGWKRWLVGRIRKMLCFKA